MKLKKTNIIQLLTVAPQLTSIKLTYFVLQILKVCKVKYSKSYERRGLKVIPYTT